MLVVVVVVLLVVDAVEVMIWADSFSRASFSLGCACSVLHLVGLSDTESVILNFGNFPPLLRAKVKKFLKSGKSGN